MRLLLAEDDPISRRMLERTVARAGYEVIVARNGVEARELLLRRDAPPLAILDWLMPDMDGVQICREVRGRMDAPYTYLLLLTARGQSEDLVAGMEAGADDYLTRPFDWLELQARLRAAERILDLQNRLVGALDALRDQASRDGLTGLWNQSTILDYLKGDLAQAERLLQPLAVILAELDGFERVSPAYGHLVGDAVLQEVAHRLSAALGTPHRVGRYGGEEFLIVLRGYGPSEVMAVAERLRASVSATRPAFDTMVTPFTLSLGVAHWPGTPDLKPWHLVRAAECALQRAKDGGGNRLEVARPADFTDMPAGAAFFPAPQRELAAR